jgi:hypothetical protein
MDNKRIRLVSIQSKEDYLREMEEQWQKEIKKIKQILKRGY